MGNEIKIYDQGIENYSNTNVVLNNLIMILWITLGTIGCWFFNPLIGWIYITVAVIMIYIVLRKLLCINCYYYNKSCGMGWGKLSALFFKEGNIEKFKYSLGLKLAPLTYGLLTIIPLVLLIISMIFQFDIFKLIVLILLLLVAFYSGGISRKKGCRKCKMRLICPGCAVSEETTN